MRERRPLSYRYEVLARMRACRAHAMKTPRVLPRDGEEIACRLIFSFLVSIGFFRRAEDSIPRTRIHSRRATPLTVLCPTDPASRGLALRYNTKVELPEQELPRLKAASRQGKRDRKEELLGQHLSLAVLKGISEPTWPSSLLATIVSEPKKPLRASATISLEIKSKSIDLSEAELRTLHGMLNVTVHQLEVEAAS